MSNDPKFVSIDLSKLEAPKYVTSCLLCDKDIPVNLTDSSTVICEECKELWKRMKESRYIDLDVALDAIDNLDRSMHDIDDAYERVHFLPKADVVEGPKYRKAVLVLQAIAQHMGRRKGYGGNYYTDEWTEASAFRDCQEAACRCLKSLNEPIMMPNNNNKIDK